MEERKKVLVVFGTRPEAIKMIPLVKFLRKRDFFDVKVCVTAQHREMLDQVLRLFAVVPDFDLDIMRPNQDLVDITIKIMSGMQNVINEFNPEIVLVHGDTTTCMATSITAFLKRCKIGHVEAGLRTYNLNSPWPEELNRQVTDRAADFYFAPTLNAKKNLLNEGVEDSKIFVTGNTVIDALYLIKDKLDSDSALSNDIKISFESLGINILGKYILVTGHRRENFGRGFMNICRALKELALKYKDIQIVYPVHLNPNVKKLVYNEIGNVSNIKLIPPQDYLPFVYLMNKSFLILTDSGGIQEEGPSLNKPILVMRDTTERPEAILAGVIKLVGANSDGIVQNVSNLIDDNVLYNAMVNNINPYGDGRASSRISDLLEQKL